MTIIRRPALPCSVVWRPLTAPLPQQLVTLCLDKTALAHRPPYPLTHPPPYMRHPWYFVPHLKKTLKNQHIQIGGTYIVITSSYCLVVLPCKSYTATVRYRRVMWYWVFQIGISQIFKCAHLVDFHWPSHILCIDVQMGWFGIELTGILCDRVCKIGFICTSYSSNLIRHNLKAKSLKFYIIY